MVAKTVTTTPAGPRGAATQTRMARLLGWLVALATVTAEGIEAKLGRRIFSRRTDGFLSVAPAMMIVGIVVGAVVVYLVLASLFPTLAGATAQLNQNITNDTVTFGDDTTDTIKPTFAIVIGLSALLGVVAIALAVWSRVG